MMNPERRFAALVLSHGRPDRVHTLRTLRRSGYTGPVHIVVDDEDARLSEYREAFGSDLIVFSKSEVAATFDEADNFAERRTVAYARNAFWGIARDLGLTHFVQLDDDYQAFSLRAGPGGSYGTWNITFLDEVFDLLLDYLDMTPALSVAMAQGGDYIGGLASSRISTIKASRKAMNSFL